MEDICGFFHKKVEKKRRKTNVRAHAAAVSFLSGRLNIKIR